MDKCKFKGSYHPPQYAYITKNPWWTCHYYVIIEEWKMQNGEWRMDNG
jgi:hypothetical protein